MAVSSSLRSRGQQNAWDNIAASQTDSVLVAASGNSRIRVHAFIINQGDTTPSSVQFNTKGSGAGTACYPLLKFPANGGICSPDNDEGWFATNPGEGLTVSTGAGSTTGVSVTYSLF